MKTKASFSVCIFFYALITLTFCNTPLRAFLLDDPIPLLERTITITLEQERLDVALKKISEQGGFIFSYNSSIIDLDKTVSHNFKEKTIREVLDQIFNGSIQYKARGKYVILTKAQTSTAKDQRVLTGYV